MGPMSSIRKQSGVAPLPKTTTSTIGFTSYLTSTLDALRVAQHVMEMFRRTLPNKSGGTSPVVDRLANRLTKSLPNFDNSPANRSGQIGRITRAAFTNVRTGVQCALQA